MSNIIFYFTGTGNCLKAAKDIAEGLGGAEIISMGEPYELEGSYENIGFVYPVYCGGMPGAVGRFVKRLDLSQNKQSYIFAVSTSGGTGGGLPVLSKTISEKGAKLSYGTDVKCFANYICMYDMKSGAEQKARMQSQAVGRIVKDLQKRAVRQDFKNHILSLAHGLFLKFMTKNDRHYNVNSDCNYCGICKCVCPVGNIEIQDGQHKFLGHCEQCTACIQWCPKQALNFKNKTQNRSRYHHPDITVNDMFETTGAQAAPL